MGGAVENTGVRRLRGCTSAEDGFTLVELLSALVVFAIMSSAVVYGLIAAAQGTRGGRNRVVAANLLQQQMEQLRLATLTPNGLTALPLGATSCTGTACSPSAVVDGVAYTISRSASWVPNETVTDPCASTTASSKYAYLRVSLTGTWPSSTGVAPVRSDSVFTPALGDNGATTGSWPVKVLDAAGNPVAGVSVGLTSVGGSGGSPPAQTTDATGCALFIKLVPGSYTAASSTPPAQLVDAYGSGTHTSGSVAVEAGKQASPLTWQLDRPASVSFTSRPDVAGTYPAPPRLLATIGNSSPNPTFSLAVAAATGGAFSASGLFPFLGGDSVWAGSCPDADPRSYAGGAASPTLGLSPGGATTGTVTVRSVQVNIKRITTGYPPISGARVWATHAASAGCAGAANPAGGAAVGEAYDLGTTTDTGMLTVGLPYGPWTFLVTTVNGATYSGTQYTTVGTGSTTTVTPPVLLSSSPSAITSPAVINVGLW